MRYNPLNRIDFTDTSDIADYKRMIMPISGTTDNWLTPITIPNIFHGALTDVLTSGSSMKVPLFILGL